MAFSVKRFFLFFFVKSLGIGGVLLALSHLSGESVIRWETYELRLQTGTLLGALFLSFLGTSWTYSVLKRFIHLPRRWHSLWAHRQEQKAQELFLQGLIALVGGKPKEAFAALEKAEQRDPQSPILPFFSGLAALYGHEKEKAQKKFHLLCRQSNTQFLGYEGLSVLDKDQNHGHFFAQQALALEGESPQVLMNLIEHNVREGRFDSALTLLEQLRLLDETQEPLWIRKRALLFWGKAQQEEKEGNLDDFYQSIHQALKDAPSFHPALFHLIRYYAESYREMKGWKWALKGYERAPHREFLSLISLLFPTLSPIERYQKGEKLTEFHPDCPETHWILGHLALEAHLWGAARASLDRLVTLCPTQSSFAKRAFLMTLETPDRWGDIEKMYQKALQAPKDPVWTCDTCAHASLQWTMHCEGCGGFDRLILRKESLVVQGKEGLPQVRASNTLQWRPLPLLFPPSKGSFSSLD